MPVGERLAASVLSTLGKSGQKRNPKEERLLRRVMTEWSRFAMRSQVCESIAAESEAEEFDSPEIEVVKDQFPIADADHSLFDPTSINIFLKESNYIREVSDQSERQCRCQKCPIRMKLRCLVSSLSQPDLLLLGRCLPFHCEKTIHGWFHTRKEQVAR
jgi:hypothetical protein